MNKPIDFYFDFVSPYTFISFQQIKSIKFKLKIPIISLKNTSKDLIFLFGLLIVVITNDVFIIRNLFYIQK